MDVNEFWNQKPAFLEPSGTQYFRAKYHRVLSDRGLENRLLDSLVMTMPEGTIVAGGFMTAVVADTTDAQDIDLFFTSELAFRRACILLMEGDKSQHYNSEENWAIAGYEVSEDCKAYAQNILEDGENHTASGDNNRGPRFLKFVHPKRPPIQLLKLAWYKNAEQVIDSFDITVAQFAVDCATGDLVANPISFLDLARKRLVLHRMQFPSSTLRRIIKYSKKGYYACPGALTEIAKQVADHIDDDEESMVYVD